METEFRRRIPTFKYRRYGGVTTTQMDGYSDRIRWVCDMIQLIAGCTMFLPIEMGINIICELFDTTAFYNHFVKNLKLEMEKESFFAKDKRTMLGTV